MFWSRLLFVSAILVLGGGRLFAGNLMIESQRFNNFCNWTTSELALLKDVDDGRLDKQSLLEAALFVAGHGQQEVARLESLFAESCQRCRSMTRVRPQTVDARKQISQLFEYLVSNHLYGEYQPELCDVGATISQGNFNCLTATILFQALCEEFEIDVVAAWEPAHVRCWVPTEDGAGYLIETTAESPAGGVSALYPKTKLKQRQLTREQLLGKVFYNRGVQALGKHQFRLALTSTWASCLLDTEDAPAANNLRACLNNWALSLARDRDRPAALQLLDAGLRLDPNYQPFSRNRELLEND